MAVKKTNVAKVPEVIDMPVQEEALELVEDKTFVEQSGLAVREFLKNAVVFFGKARAIELAAKQTLAEMDQRKVPTSSAVDEVLQLAIKKANRDKKDATDFWGITQTVHAIHGRLVAARTRATKPLEDAAKRGNELHNTWVANDRERMRLEQEAEDRRIRETQERVRQEELERMEKAALKAESEMDGLSVRETLFVGCIVDRGSSTPALQAQAARIAGYKDPDGIAARLMNTGKILAAISAQLKAVEIRRQAFVVAATPVESIPVAYKEVKSNVTVAAGVRGDRTTWSAECFDPELFKKAVIEGKHGIPWTCLKVDEVALNQYATSMKNGINAWPGVRAKSKTGVQ